MKEKNLSGTSKTPRRLERIFAFKVLYGLAFSPVTDEAALKKAFCLSPDKPESIEDARGFAWELVFGAWSRQAELDVALNAFSRNWRVERIGKVEGAILRLALYELMYRPDVPAKAAINEAVELSKQFGDEASRAFINGILDAAAKAAAAGEFPHKATPR